MMGHHHNKSLQQLKVEFMIGEAYRFWILAWAIGMLLQHYREGLKVEFFVKNACNSCLCACLVLLLLQVIEITFLVFPRLQSNGIARWLQRRYKLCVDSTQIEIKAQSLLLPVEFILLLFGFYWRFRLYFLGTIVAGTYLAMFLFYYKCGKKDSLEE